MSGKDSIIVDSLNHCLHADSVNIDSLNNIINANTAVFDSDMANNILKVNTLTNHIQILQNQIDSLEAHSMPLKHLGYLAGHHFPGWQAMDIVNKSLHLYWVYFICFVIYLLVRNCIKRQNKLSPSNTRKKDDKPKILEKINNLISLKPKNLWRLGIKWLILIVAFLPLLPLYYVFFLKQCRDYFGPFKGNKIKLHRELYSKDGNPLLWFSAKVAFFIPLTLWIVTTGSEFFHLNLAIYHAPDSLNESSAFWQIICQYLDPGNVANSQGYGGSGIALLSALLGIVCLSGFLVSAIVNVISQTRIQWQKGLINYNSVKDFDKYVVIIGINEQTASIARRALDSDDNRYVLIQTRQDVEKVRPELESKIDDDKQDRIVYYAGDRTSYEDIEKLHLEKAIEVYILGESVENTDKKNNEDQQEKEHDAYNISCLEHISRYIKEDRDKIKKELENAKEKLENTKEKLENAMKEGSKMVEFQCRYEYDKCEDEYTKVLNKPRLNVHVQFDYQSTFTAFKATHLYQKLGRDIRFIPFNIHELWAKKVLVDNLAIYPAGNKTELKVQRYLPIDGKEGIGVNNKEKTVHLVIFGMNQMGTALATQAALLCHFPNFVAKKSKKTVITFIDGNAIREAEYYMGRYSTLFELSHYRIVKLNGNEANSNEFNWKTTDPFKTGKYNHLITKADKEIITVKKDDKEETIEKPCLLDVEWEFIQGNAASKPVQDYIKEIVGNEQKIMTIAICFNDSQQSLASAMYLPRTVYDNCNQVLVYQRSIFDVARDVATGDSDWRRYRNLFPFGMSEASYTENPFDSHLAALDYYLYKDEKRFKLVKQYFDSDKTDKNFEDSFLKNVDDTWENAGIVRKTASIDSVDSIPFKLRSMGIEYCRDLDGIEEIVGEKTKDEDIKNAIVEAEHNRWMMQRLISGFRPFTKDEQKYVENLRTLIEEVRNNIKLEDREFIKKLNELRDVFLKEINNEKEKKSRKEEFDRIINDVVKIKSDEKKVNDLLNSIGRVIEHRIDEKKDGERVSYCICSFKRMKKIAERMISNDKSVIESIPILLRGQELLNVLILTSDDGRYENSQHKKILEEIFKGKFLRIEGRKEECKEDKVYCKHAFRMADTAVSREQWQDVTGEKLYKDEDKDKEAELPVVFVSKNEVEDFLAILRKKSGLYFDIPSQKEWRNANDSGCTDNDDWNVRTDSDKEIAPVKVRTDNRSNVLQHFYGNVWEWSRSQDDHELYKFMGGSFRFKKQECKPDANKVNDERNHYWWHSWDADSKSDDLGFRLVWKYDRGILPVDANADAREEESKATTQRNEMSEAIEKWFKGVKHQFVKVDSGCFVMGADKDTSDNPDANEGPRHTVHISKPFYMCKVPVTQSLWNAVMDVEKPRLNPTTNRVGDEIPQTDVCWSDEKNGDGVKEFMRKLNDSLKSKESFKKIIKSFISEEDAKKLDNGKLEFRLPTEAEWEYAAKGGNDKRLNPKHFRGFRYVYAKIWDYKGEIYYRKKKKNIITYNDYSSMFNNSAIDCAWFGQPSIHEVAQKEPNALGLYDMSGNVWEWCHDYYIADMYDACKIGKNENIQNTFFKHEYQDKGYLTDPIALDDSYSAHVFRGGSWRSSEWDCRCTRANYWGENYKANDLGFRLVLGVPISELGEAEKEKNTVNTKTSKQS